MNAKSLTPTPRLPLILAPTRFEYTTIKAAIDGHALAADVECVGIGPGALWRWANLSPSARSEVSPPGRLVLLAGLAGALDPTLRFADIASASRIVAAGADFARPSPSFVPPVRGNRTSVIASVDEIITTSTRKAALFKSTGAALVDMESAAFASLASQRKWNWGVLRVVSDDAMSDVPEWICALLRSDGSVDLNAVLAGVAAHPSRLRTLRSLAVSLRQPLEALVQELVRIVDNSQRPPRTLVFGGTFDPPHRRHCDIVAQGAAMMRCESIIILPAGRSPLRLEHEAASNADRLEMTRRAFAHLAGATVDARELDRGGRSFTVQTLREIASERGLGRSDLILLIGADQALQFDQWKDWREIDEQLATVAVVARPPREANELATELAQKFAALGSDGERWRKAVLPIKAVELSASEVRLRLRAGGPIDDLVQEEVAAWIRQRALYA